MPDLRSAEHAEQTRRVLTMVRWLLTMAFVVIGYLMVRALGPVLAPILAAGGVAYMLDGAVDRLEARGVRRVVAVTGMLILFVAIVATALIVLIPLASSEIAHFIESMPRMLDTLGRWVHDNLGLQVPQDWVAFFRATNSSKCCQGGEAARGDQPPCWVSCSRSWGLAGMLIPVFAFYLGRQGSHHGPGPARSSARHRTTIGEVMTEIDSAVSIWIRGQLIVMAILAVLYAVAFKIIGISSRSRSASSSACSRSSVRRDVRRRRARLLVVFSTGMDRPT
jgi:predicted PurR-regulated permease PerM